MNIMVLKVLKITLQTTGWEEIFFRTDGENSCKSESKFFERK